MGDRGNSRSSSKKRTFNVLGPSFHRQRPTEELHACSSTLRLANGVLRQTVVDTCILRHRIDHVQGHELGNDARVRIRRHQSAVFVPLDPKIIQ